MELAQEFTLLVLEIQRNWNVTPGGLHDRKTVTNTCVAVNGTMESLPVHNGYTIIDLMDAHAGVAS